MLITLGIIGVVVAMTLPSLINNKKNKELETAFKKNYSVISQALNMYYAQNGERLTPETCGIHQLRPILMQYMDVLYDCENADLYQPHKYCVPKVESDDVIGTAFGGGYMNFNNTTKVGWGLLNDGQFVLTDGSLILLENTGSASKMYISVDVNGCHRRPNQLGHDLFMFQIDNKGNLLPMGVKGTDFYDENDKYCSLSSTDLNNGAGCTIKAINEKDYFTKLH